MNYDIKAIGARVRDLREARELTQDVVADACGFAAKGKISDLENGKVKSIALDRAIALARFFNISLDQLLFGKQEYSNIPIGPNQEELMKVIATADQKTLEAIFHLIGLPAYPPTEDQD